MLTQRLSSGFLMAAVAVAAVFWLPAPFIPVLVAGLAVLALREVYGLLKHAQIGALAGTGAAAGVLLILATDYARLYVPHHAGDVESLAMALVILGVLTRHLWQKNNPQPLTAMAGTLLGIAYAAYLLNFIGKLALGWPYPQGRWLALYLIVIVKFNDIGAYCIGCSIGRHKLIPRISPAKTWEGALGGAATAVAASLAFHALAGPRAPFLPGAGHAVLLGLLLAAAGTVGDLLESFFKRAAGQKDSGRLVRGMGGLLDVIDSLVLAAPLLYGYARLFSGGP